MFDKSKPRPAGKSGIFKKKKDGASSRPDARREGPSASKSGRASGKALDARNPRATKGPRKATAAARDARGPRDASGPRNAKGPYKLTPRKTDAAGASRSRSVAPSTGIVRKAVPLARKPAQILRKAPPRSAVNLGIGPVEIAPPKDQPPTIGLLAAKAALDKKALDVVLLDVRGVSGLCDEMVVASARSVTHLGAVCDGVEDALRLKGERLLHSDGRHGAEPDWILLDYGDLMVHLFRPEAREYTKLEDYYASAKLVAKWGGEED